LERALAAFEALVWLVRTLAKAMFPFFFDDAS
jgi:hypothetical protein